jgi:hypothetical protein
MDIHIKRHNTANDLNLEFFFSSGRVRQRSLGTSVTNCTIVPAPDDRWVWGSRLDENWQEKQKSSEETCPNATLSTINPTLSELA